MGEKSALLRKRDMDNTYGLPVPLTNYSIPQDFHAMPPMKTPPNCARNRVPCRSYKRGIAVKTALPYNISLENQYSVRVFCTGDRKHWNSDIRPRKRVSAYSPKEAVIV